MSDTPQRIHELARLVSRADAALIAATAGRGMDGHGDPLPDLPENLDKALEAVEQAWRIAAEIRRGEA